MEKLLYTTKAAAEFLGVSTKTIKNWRKSGKLTPIKTGENGYCFCADFQLGKIKTELGKNKVGKFPTSTGETGETGENISQSGEKQTREVGKQTGEVGKQTGEVGKQTGEDKTRELSLLSPLSRQTRENKSGENEYTFPTSEKNKAADKAADKTQNENSTISKNSQQKFDISEQISAVKSIDPQTLLNYGVLDSARKKGITCMCGNGSGEDGTGVEPYLNPHNIWIYHCFKCDKNYTNIDYLANYFRLDPKNNFVEIIKKSCETFHIPFPEFEKKTKDYSNFYKYAQSNLVGWLKSIGEKWRGLTVSTLQHFNCGFANNRVIIPYNNLHYLARAIHDGESDPKKHHGSKSIFNISAISLDVPTLILEGEIDAMSIWQATSGAVSAIAVGGVGEYKMLIRELNKIYEHSDTKPKFIVLFDNDNKDGKNAGQDGAKVAVTALLNAGYPAVNRILSDEKNIDANDILQRDGNEKLNDIIQEIIAESQEELHEVEKNIEKYRQNNDSNDEKPIPEELKLTDEQKKFLYDGEGYDLDNARRVAYLFQDKIRFIRDLHEWATFDNGVWHIGSGQNSDIYPLVSRMADILKANATNKTELSKALPFKAHKKFSPIVSTMKGVESILITQKDLNTHKNLLNVKNGVVDLQTGKLYPHSPNLYFTQITNAAYFPEHNSETVEKFLQDILPDEPTRAALLRFLGYSITGSCQEEKALFINGSGGNGKGTLTKLIMTCLGDFAISFPIEGILESGRFVDANAATPAFNCLLFNRLAISEEIPAGKKLNAAKFKILTGGDPLPIRHLYQEMTVIKDPTHTMIFSGNHLPELEDAHDPGILRRLLNIHFTQSFTGDKCDEGLKQRLLSSDSLNGLLALLVENSQEWYKSGLIISDAMKQARQDYLDSQDFIADFINEHCKRDPQSSIPRTEFLKRLRKECDATATMTDRALTSAIEKVDGIYYRRGTGGSRNFYGISWLDEQDVPKDIFEGVKIHSDDIPL